MAFEQINRGTTANDGTGDNLREAFRKVNDNFDDALEKVTTPSSVYGTDLSGEQTMIPVSDLKDVLEFADLASFPATGESGKIYVALDTNLQYRWSGSAYVQIGGGSELPDEDIWTYFKGDLYMCQVTGASLSNIGYPANPTLVGTGTFLTANLSSTYASAPYSTWNHRRQISASTAGSNASVTWGWANVSCGLGFYASAKVNVLMTANGRFFLGLTDSTSDIGNVNPSTLTNILGFGIDSLDANLQILHNDNTGTATKLDLGADFSINAISNNTYLLEIWNFQGSTTVYFRIKNLLTEITSAIIEVTTDVPTVTDGLAFHLWSNNGTDASEIRIHFSNHTLKRQS